MAVTTFADIGNNGDHSAVSFIMDGDPNSDKVGVLIPDIDLNTKTHATVGPEGTGPRIIAKGNYTEDYVNGFRFVSGTSGWNRENDHDGSPLIRAYRFEGDGTNPAGAVSVATTGPLFWMTSDDTVFVVNEGPSGDVVGYSEPFTVRCRTSHFNRLFTWSARSSDFLKVHVMGRPRRVLTDIVEYDIIRLADGRTTVTLTGHRIDGGPDVNRIFIAN